MVEKFTFNMKAMNSNKVGSTQHQHHEQGSTPSAPFQYGLSVTIGVITLLLLSATYYFGIFGAY